MLLTRELLRLVRDLVGFVRHSHRASLLIAVVGIAVVAILSITVTTVVPVVVYPFL